jgi:hypothetical protein
VSKNRDRTHQAGRSTNWIKVKNPAVFDVTSAVLSFPALHEPDHAGRHQSKYNNNGKRFKRPCVQNL